MGETMRVFVPHDLPALDQNVEGHLVGWHQISSKDNRSATTVFIMALIPYGKESPFFLINPKSRHRSASCGFVGTFERQLTSRPGAHALPATPPRARESTVQLHVRLTDSGQLNIAAGVLQEPAFKHCDIDLVLYDPSQFARVNPDVVSPPAGEVDQRSAGGGGGASLIQTLSMAVRDFRASDLRKVGGLVDFTASSDHSWLAAGAASALTKCVTVGASLVGKLCRGRHVTFLIDKTSKFSISAQMKTRFLQLEYLSKVDSNPGQAMRFWNTSLAIFVDFFLGLFLTAVIYQTISVAYLDVFLDWTNLLVGNLRSLLVWLMGNPAGFKLNQRLSSSMGSFFTYHIYLWEAYLYIIKPALETMLAIIFYCGFLGLTFQLGMLNDLLTFATFHVYCFYAYAAKLYHLNFIGLISYWRLFRGKKWNPLRQRVDSCTYNVDQLFMGTLCFTTLLFLLPTTLLYYTVFTILRIPILLLQGIIYKMMGFVNQLPLYALVLFIMQSRCLVGRVNFEVVPACTSKGPLIMTMKAESCSLNVAVFTFLPMVAQRGDKTTWWALLKNLMTGKLIYQI